ncbi:MAG: hypothetical protein ACQEP4_03840 [Bacillota bacterium]
MDKFTKKRIKKPGELVEGIKSGDFSLIKRELSVKKSKKTAKMLSKDGKKIKEKLDQLKQIHHRLTDKDSQEKKNFIKRKMPGKK